MRYVAEFTFHSIQIFPRVQGATVKRRRPSWPADVKVVMASQSAGQEGRCRFTIKEMGYNAITIMAHCDPFLLAGKDCISVLYEYFKWNLFRNICS